MGRRKQTEAELNRRRRGLMGHAATVFADRGYHGATMETIAEAAKCSAATLYTYFSGKADLFQAILDGIQEEMLHAVDAPVPEGLDTAGALAWMMGRLGSLADRYRSLLLTRLLQLQGGLTPSTSARLRAALIDFYRDVFDRGQQAGEVRTDRDALDLAIAYDGMAMGVATQRLLNDQSPLSQIDQVISLFLEGAGR